EVGQNITSILITWGFCQIIKKPYLNDLNLLCFLTFPFLILAIISVCCCCLYTHLSGKVLKLNLPPKQNKIHELGYNSDLSAYF
uniref:Uncharacterized protein n=1 Tax=Neovison vison TaxID=452646 RepID=A0A8C7AWC9_NEOVI